MDKKAQYVKNKAFNDDYYKKLILEYLSKFGKASKKEIRELIIDKLPDVLDDKQKENKLRNLLYDMSKKGLIVRDSDNFKNSKWQLPDES